MKKGFAYILVFVLLLCAVACAENLSSEKNFGRGVLPPVENGEYVHKGVSYKIQDGVFTVNGTSESTSFYQMDGTYDSIPAWAYAMSGKTLRAEISTDSALRLVIRAFDGAHPDGFFILNTHEPVTFEMPDLSALTGLYVRLQVAGGKTLDNVVVKPVIYEVAKSEAAKPVQQAVTVSEPVKKSAGGVDYYHARNLLPAKNDSRVASGVSFVVKDGVYEVNGTAEKSTYFPVDGNESTIPDWVYALAGEKVYVDFEANSDLRLTIRVFTDEKPNGYYLVRASRNASFTVPDPTAINGFAVRLQVPEGSTIENEVVEPIFMWEKSNEGLDWRFKQEISGENPPMLTIIDDDGDIKYYTELYPLALEKHVSIATAVTTKRIESGNDRWMTWEQIQEVYSNGMEVLCHTYTHPVPADLKGVSKQELVWRLQTAKQRMEMHGIMTGDFVVYSSSTGDMEIVQDAAKQVFDGGVRVGYNTTNFNTSDPYSLARYRIDYDYEYDIEKIRAMLDELKETGGWMIWMMHTSGKWTDKSLSAVSQAIDYCEEIGIPIVTTDYAMKTYFGK